MLKTRVLHDALDLPDLWPCLRAHTGQCEDDGWYTGLYIEVGVPKDYKIAYGNDEIIGNGGGVFTIRLTIFCQR